MTMLLRQLQPSTSRRACQECKCRAFAKPQLHLRNLLRVADGRRLTPCDSKPSGVDVGHEEESASPDVASTGRASKSGEEDESTSSPAADTSSWQDAVKQAANSFTAMSPAQRAWLVAATIVALVALPRALILVLVAAERLVVGSLLATETLIASLLLRTAVVGGGVGLVGLLLWGLYAFVVNDKSPGKK